MKKIEKLTATFFWINNKALYYNNEDGFYLLNKLKTIKIYDKPDGNRVLFYRNELVILNSLNKVVYSSSFFENLQIIKDVRISDILEDYIVFYDKKPTVTYTIYNLKNNTSFVFHKNYFEYYLNKIFYTTIEKKVISLKKINILWSFNLSNNFNFYRRSNYENAPDEYYEAEIIRIIGEYEGVLWLVLNNGRLLGLDTQTGNLKHDLLKPLNFVGEEKRYFEVSLFSDIDKDKGILFGISHTHYFEIDLKNPEESYYYYDISETCKQNQIEADYPSYDLVWHGNEIFIGQNQLHYDKYPCGVGIFDRATKQITWTSQLLEEKIIFKGIKKIDYSENRLYVLDMEGNLYVFEREV